MRGAVGENWVGETKGIPRWTRVKTICSINFPLGFVRQTSAEPLGGTPSKLLVVAGVTLEDRALQPAAG